MQQKAGAAVSALFWLGVTGFYVYFTVRPERATRGLTRFAFGFLAFETARIWAREYQP